MKCLNVNSTMTSCVMHGFNLDHSVAVQLVTLILSMQQEFWISPFDEYLKYFLYYIRDRYLLTCLKHLFCVTDIRRLIHWYLMDTFGTAMGRHLPYGITQCYLPPDTSKPQPARPVLDLPTPER